MSQPRLSSALHRARKALRKAQRELDLRDGRQGDLWAVLDSMAATVELWEEETSAAKAASGFARPTSQAEAYLK